MDNTDLKILQILRQDGRITMKALGGMVGLTSPAVQERVKRLEATGVIEGYSANINYSLIDDCMNVLVFIMVMENSLNSFIKYCESNNQIQKIERILFTEANFMIYINTKNTQTLEQIIIELHRYGQTKTAICLSTYLEKKDNIEDLL